MMDPNVLNALYDASLIGWAGAAAGALFGAVEWFVLPQFVEQSIRTSNEGRKLPAKELDAVVALVEDGDPRGRGSNAAARLRPCGVDGGLRERER